MCAYRAKGRNQRLAKSTIVDGNERLAGQLLRLISQHQHVTRQPLDNFIAQTGNGRDGKIHRVDAIQRYGGGDASRLQVCKSVGKK